MRALLNCRNQGKILQILLQDLSSIFNKTWTTWRPCLGTLGLSSKVCKRLLGKLKWALREFDIRILVNEFFMKGAEILVFLADHPLFVIKVNLYHILCVLPIINRIDVYSSLLYTNAKRYLKEVTSCVSIVFVTRLHMVNKYLWREENLAELALHRLGMLKYSLEYLYLP